MRLTNGDELMPRCFDGTVEGTESQLGFWYRDDLESTAMQRRWGKARGLYVTSGGRSHLRVESPMAYTVGEIVEAIERAWLAESLSGRDVLWMNAEQHALRWDEKEWHVFDGLLRLAMASIPDLHVMTPVEWYGIHDRSYAWIDRIVMEGRFAINGVYNTRWYAEHLRLLRRSQAAHKLPFVSTTLSSKAQFTENVHICANEFGRAVLWSGSNVTESEREGLNWGAREMDRIFGEYYPTTKPGARDDDGETPTQSEDAKAEVHV